MALPVILLRVCWCAGLGALLGLGVALILEPDMVQPVARDGWQRLVSLLIAAIFYAVPGVVVFWDVPLPADWLRYARMKAGKKRGGTRLNVTISPQSMSR